LVFQFAGLLSNGLLQLDGLGQAGWSVRLETTTNLGPGAVWLPLFTNPPGSDRFQFIVPSDTDFPQRFYRAAGLP